MFFIVLISIVWWNLDVLHPLFLYAVLWRDIHPHNNKLSVKGAVKQAQFNYSFPYTENPNKLTELILMSKLKLSNGSPKNVYI